MANIYFDSGDWTRLVRFDSARAEDLNAIVDSITVGFDTVETKTNAALRLPDGETAATIPAVASRQGRVLGFNATTGAVETVITATEISNAQTYATDAQTYAMDAQNSVNSAAAQVSLATTQANNAANSATAASNSAISAASSAALCSSAAINTLNPRTYFFFTM